MLLSCSLVGVHWWEKMVSGKSKPPNEVQMVSSKLKLTNEVKMVSSRQNY